MLSPEIDKKTMFDNIFEAVEQTPKVTVNPPAHSRDALLAGDADDFFYVDLNGANKVTLESKEVDYLRGLVDTYCPKP